MMDVTNLQFTSRYFGKGCDQQEVDRFLDLVAASLALSPAERTLRAQDAAKTRSTVTKFRLGYDIEAVDKALAELGVELDLPSPF
jgi:DivIVA domain-containing protein